MKIGLVGLPNSGKTTIFNLLTHQTLPTEAYFTQSTETHIGVAKFHDERLDILHKENPKVELKYAEIIFVDTAGFMAGATGKTGHTDAQFFVALRDVEAIAYVVCAFSNPEVLQIHDTIDPVRDLRKLEVEMIFNDLDMTEKRIQKIDKELQSQREKHTPEKEVLLKCKKCLEQEKALRSLSFSQEEHKLLSGFRFLSQKPAMVLLNIDEKDIGKPVSEDLLKYCKDNSFELLALSGKIEEEISEIPESEQAEFLSELGIAEPALPKFIHSAYHLLDLISFFTIGDKEIKAWSIKHGTSAWEAAGKVHTDIQRGFIRAEVVHFDDFQREGSMKAAKEKHFMHLEGKDYIVKDGDIIFFRFNI